MAQRDVRKRVSGTFIVVLGIVLLLALITASSPGLESAASADITIKREAQPPPLVGPQLPAGSGLQNRRTSTQMESNLGETVPVSITDGGFEPEVVTATVAETGGQQSLQNVVASFTDLMNQLGGVVSGSLFSVFPDSFSVPAGGIQDVNIQIDLAAVKPGVYHGALVLTSDNGGPYRVPLTLDVQFHEIYLPLVLKNYRLMATGR